MRVETDENFYVTGLFGPIQYFRQWPDVVLLDCTYKTNRFGMPLLNICGSAGNNKTHIICGVFLSSEREEDYGWFWNS